MWDVTVERRKKFCETRFLLTHPVWDVTIYGSDVPVIPISFLLTHPVWDVTINYEERLNALEFLLTHPVWDVTGTGIHVDNNHIHFYSHIPCGM